MRKLSTKWFFKWAKKANLNNQHLLEAVKNIEKGLSVSELGTNLFKVRIKRQGKGKSSGFRTLVVFQKTERVIFVYGFSKNEKSNITKTELQYFKKLSHDLLKIGNEEINKLINKKILFDIEVEK